MNDKINFLNIPIRKAFWGEESITTIRLPLNDKIYKFLSNVDLKENFCSGY